MMRYALQRRSFILIVLIVLAALGAWASDRLLLLHDAQGVAPTSLLFHWCSDTASAGGCQATARSAWAEIHLPIIPVTVPVALLGWIYFAFFAVWYLVNGSARSKVGIARWLPLTVAGFGVYVSLFLISLMMFGRVPTCAACIITHAINALLIVTVYLDAFPRERPTEKVTLAHLKQPAIALLLMIALLTVLNRGRSTAEAAWDRVAELEPLEDVVANAQTNERVLLAAYDSGPLLDVPAPRTSKPNDGQHSLVVFTDLQCPACAENDRFIRDQILPLFHGKLTVDFRHYPLCKDCNPYVRLNRHPDACRAAIAAQAALQIGGFPVFDRMIQILHRHRNELTPALYDQVATRLALPIEQFHQVEQDPATADAVKSDIELAHTLDVSETPTMFLDGRVVPDLCSTQVFWQAIAQRLVGDSAATQPATAPVAR